MILLEIAFGLILFFYYLKFSVDILRIENYKKALGFHVIMAFLFINLFLSLLPFVMENSLKSVSEFSGLFWLKNIEVLDMLISTNPVVFFIMAGAIGIASLIMCFVTIYHIFFEY